MLNGCETVEIIQQLRFWGRKLDSLNNVVFSGAFDPFFVGCFRRMVLGLGHGVRKVWRIAAGSVWMKLYVVNPGWNWVLMK